MKIEGISEVGIRFTVNEHSILRKWFWQRITPHDIYMLEDGTSFDKLNDALRYLTHWEDTSRRLKMYEELDKLITVATFYGAGDCQSKDGAKELDSLRHVLRKKIANLIEGRNENER